MHLSVYALINKFIMEYSKFILHFIRIIWTPHLLLPVTIFIIKEHSMLYIDKVMIMNEFPFIFIDYFTIP